MRHRSIGTRHPVLILHLLVTIEAGQPIVRLSIKRDIQLDNRRTGDNGLTRLQLQVLRLDHHSFVEEPVQSRTSALGQLTDIGPADLVGGFSRSLLLSGMQIPNRLQQLPDRSRQQLSGLGIARHGANTLESNRVARLRIAPGLDKHLEIWIRQSTGTGQLRL
ncbi:hypothetical protein D9M68_613690 [compost metagenome]